MSLPITSFFTFGGLPASGISPLPTIRIWEVANGSHTLVITDDSMTPVGDGFYFFDFTAFDSSKNYVIRTDAGVTFPPNERFNIGSTECDIDQTDLDAIADSVWDEPIADHQAPGSTGEELSNHDCNLTTGDINDIADAVWDETLTDHLTVGSTGEALNQVKADTQAIRIDVTTALDIVQTLLKYECNRTKISKTNMTLTIFDDDGLTPIKVFDLKDSNGAASVTEVCERSPQP